jgi:hypothetical protein
MAAEQILKSVLDLLRPFTEKGGKRKAPRRVALYSLAELFRAGATETGFVEDRESLPADIDLVAYRKVLHDEALRLASLPASTLPWYVKQQVLLFQPYGGQKRCHPSPESKQSIIGSCFASWTETDGHCRLTS